MNEELPEALAMAEVQNENLLTEESEKPNTVQNEVIYPEIHVAPTEPNAADHQEVFVNNYSQVSKEEEGFNQIQEESAEYTQSPNVLSRMVSPPVDKNTSGTHNYKKFLLKTGYKGFMPFVPIEEKFDLRFDEKQEKKGIGKMIEVKNKKKLVRRSPRKRDRSLEEI